MLTMFTWGYWGWGNTTRQLLEAVDAAESAREFKPPLFVDVRIRRSVRAAGFCGDAFAKVTGSERYLWMQRLGNDCVAAHEQGIRIKDPSAAAELLELAEDRFRNKQRVLFFCSCEDVNVLNCHRLTVAELVLNEARKLGRPLEMVEWPGGEPERRDVRVPRSIIRAVLNGRKSVPLGEGAIADGLAVLPWGSIANLTDGEHNLPVITGPCKFQSTWCLPVWGVGKGVRREAESGGSRRQSAGLTNRKRIEAAGRGERAHRRKAQYLHGAP